MDGLNNNSFLGSNFIVLMVSVRAKQHKFILISAEDQPCRAISALAIDVLGSHQPAPIKAITSEVFLLQAESNKPACLLQA